jgi:hypothetical protein
MTTTIEELMGEEFSMQFMLRIYNEEQLQLCESLETAVRRVGSWREMAASLGVSGVE